MEEGRGVEEKMNAKAAKDLEITKRE